MIATHAGFNFTYDDTTANSWPAFKPNTIFGQLPHATVDGVEVSQSMAIARVFARKANLQGDSDADFAVSEMLLEEFSDIFNMMSKANYVEPRKEAMDKAFAESLPAQLAHLAKLLGDKKTFASKLVAGDFAIAVVFEYLLALQGDCLDAYPTLKAFSEHMQALPAFETVRKSGDMPYYWKRD